MKNRRSSNKLFIGLIIINLAVFGKVGAKEATFSWTPPTTNSDGSPIEDLAGHKTFCGITSGTYFYNEDVGLASNCTFTGLVSGVTYYFTVKAYDTSGQESVFSEEIVHTVDNDLPTATLTGPSDGYTYTTNQTVSFSATASDTDGSVVRVEFYANNNKVGEDTSPPLLLFLGPSSGRKLHANRQGR